MRFLILVWLIIAPKLYAHEIDTNYLYHAHQVIDNNDIVMNQDFQQIIKFEKNELIITLFERYPPSPWMLMESARKYNEGKLIRFKIEKTNQENRYQLKGSRENIILTVKKDSTFELKYAHWTVICQPFTHLKFTLPKQSLIQKKLLEHSFTLKNKTLQHNENGLFSVYLEDIDYSISNYGIYSVVEHEGLIFLTYTEPNFVMSGFPPPILLTRVEDRRIEGIQLNFRSDPESITFFVKED